ncbi:MAG: hypothetical protein HRU82_02650 [Nitrospira sp.]|nr:MAG: hypothetical protein HRU82_02650 [Nitrospira sp.]
MAREMTPQERAAALLERMGLCGHPADSQFMGDIIEHDKQTRRAALLEAAIICRERGKPHDIEWWMTASKKEISRQTAIDCAELIDQLAQEGQAKDVRCGIFGPINERGAT